MTNKKRILNVTLTREYDESPDTSYYGEYTSKKENEYTIDRAHQFDCQTNDDHNRALIEKLERVYTYLENTKNEIEGMHGYACALRGDYSDSQDILQGAQDTLDECDCDEIGIDRNSYRYFAASTNYVSKDGTPQDNLTPAQIREYVKQDYERMERLNSGDWSMIGIRAKATVQLTGDLTQSLSSGGLWGIESDSPDADLEEIEREQLNDLRDELIAVGFSRRAISKAFKSVERRD